MLYERVKRRASVVMILCQSVLFTLMIKEICSHEYLGQISLAVNYAITLVQQDKCKLRKMIVNVEVKT